MDAREDKTVHGPLLTMDEAAEYLGISRRTLDRLMVENDVRRVHIGQAVRIPVSELDHFIATHLTNEYGEEDTDEDLPH